MTSYEGRLELTWTNKQLRLLAHEDVSGRWSLKVVGHSGVVTSVDSWCQASLPTSHLTDGATVIGVHSLSGWAGCWSVKKADVASLELLYEPPFVSPYGQHAPMLWFALH